MVDDVETMIRPPAISSPESQELEATATEMKTSDSDAETGSSWTGESTRMGSRGVEPGPVVVVVTL